MKDVSKTAAQEQSADDSDDCLEFVAGDVKPQVQEPLDEEKPKML